MTEQPDKKPKKRGRSPGDGARFIAGPPHQPKAYPAPDGNDWSTQEWMRLKAPLKAPIQDSARQEILKATKAYVEQTTSHDTKTNGEIKDQINKWRQATQALRKHIWSSETDLTSWAGSHDNGNLSIDRIDRTYFGKHLRKTIRKRIHGRSRQLLAVFALGLDVSLALGDYAAQEMRNPERGTRPWRLWYVWVALLYAILRENQIRLANFNAFVLALQATLPEECPAHAESSLQKDIRVALKFSGTSQSKTLFKLLKYRGSFDRVRRPKDGALLQLIQREHLLSRSNASKS